MFVNNRLQIGYAILSVMVFGFEKKVLEWCRVFDCLLQKKIGYEPSAERVCCWNSTGQEVWVFLEELVTSKQGGKSLCWP